MTGGAGAGRDAPGTGSGPQGPRSRRGLLDRLLALLRGMGLRQAPLCDTCKYDYGNVCTRPERPNALRCPDYRRR